MIVRHAFWIEQCEKRKQKEKTWKSIASIHILTYHNALLLTNQGSVHSGYCVA